MPVLLLAGAVLFARRRFDHVATSMALDGIVGALACAAIGVTLLQGTLLDLTRPGTDVDARGRPTCSTRSPTCCC